MDNGVWMMTGRERQRRGGIACQDRERVFFYCFDHPCAILCVVTRSSSFVSFRSFRASVSCVRSFVRSASRLPSCLLCLFIPSLPSSLPSFLPPFLPLVIPCSLDFSLPRSHLVRLTAWAMKTQLSHSQTRADPRCSGAQTA